MEWLGEYAKLSRVFRNFRLAQNNTTLVEELEATTNICCDYLPNMYCHEKTECYDRPA
jgi:hypothetical protein